MDENELLAPDAEVSAPTPSPPSDETLSETPLSDVSPSSSTYIDYTLQIEQLQQNQLTIIAQNEQIVTHMQFQSTMYQFALVLIVGIFLYRVFKMIF